MCSEKPIALHSVSQKFAQRRLWNSSSVHLIDDGSLSSFQGRSSSTWGSTSLLQAIYGVTSLALCPQVVSQAFQHFRSSEKQATCEGCLVRQSVCLVISFHCSVSRAVHLQESTIGTLQSGPPVPLFTFCSSLIESVRMVACLVRPLEANQQRAWLTASTSM